MKYKRLLAAFLSVTMVFTMLATITLNVSALEVGDTVSYEAEETMIARYDNLTIGTITGLSSPAPSVSSTPNAICASAAGIPQITYPTTSASVYVPLYYVFEITVPEDGVYSMTVNYRGHGTGRMVSIYAGDSTGLGEDLKLLDVSGDQLLGKVNGAYFSGGNSNHIETQNVSATGRLSSTDPRANEFYLPAGKIYIKSIITGVASGATGIGTTDAGTRLNVDLLKLKLVTKAGGLADYSEVEAAKARVPADLTTMYTAETVTAVNEAIAAVDYTKLIADQADVDAMAKAINEAVKALALITPVDAAQTKCVAIDCQNPAKSSHAFVTTQKYDDGTFFSRFEGVNAGDYAQYNIDVPVAGYYLLTIDYRAHESVGKAYFYLNGEKQENNFDSPGSANSRQQIILGKYYFYKGDNSLKFEMYAKGSNNAAAKLNIFNFILDPYKDPEPTIQVEGEPINFWAFETTDPANSTPDVFGIDQVDIPVSFVNTTGAGQYAQYKFDIEYPGEYKLLVRYRSGATSGFAKAYVNGEEVAKPFDSSGMNEKVYYDNLGYHNFVEGENTLKFEITGKGATRNGYNLIMYSFYLVPVNYKASTDYGFTELSPAVSTEKVNIYPMYSVNQLSSLYTVTADDKNLPVIQYGASEYDYGEFSMKSGPVTVKVAFKDDINKYEISPKKLGITGTVSGKTLTFTLEKDEYIIIKINDNGRRLIITADPGETDVPASSGTGIFNITEAKYGADHTGKIISTDAIQRAVDDAAAYAVQNSKSGIVYVPPGVYQSGTIMLRSNVSLYLAGGVTLWGSTREMDWMPKGRKESIGRAVSYFVFTDNNTVNTKVYGRGTVDGNAKTFKNTVGWNYAIECLAPLNSSYFSTDGITYRGSGVWCVVPAWCQNLEFTNFKVYNNVGYGEDDGIDIVGCQNVVVRNSISVNWDDPYSTKTQYEGFEINAGWGPAAGKNTKNENILFEDCLAWTGCYGFKIGQGIGYDQHDITVKDSTVYDCAVGFGIHHKRYPAKVYNIVFDGIDVENITRSNEDHKMWFQCFSENNDNNADLLGNIIHDITVKNINVRARSTTLPKMIARKDGTYISNVTFENITMYGSTAPMATMGQLGFTMNTANPGLNISGDLSSKDKTRGHVYNARNYGVLGTTSSKIPAVYYNNSGSAIATESEATALGGMTAKLTASVPALYNMVDFGSGISSIDIRFASAVSNGQIELRLDSASGTLIGTLDASGSSASVYKVNSVQITGASGIHDLYLVAKNGTINLDYIDILRTSNAVMKGQDTIKDVNFGGGTTSIDVRVRSTNSVGMITLREGGASGTVIGTINVGLNTSSTLKTLTLSSAVTGVKDIYIEASEGVDVESISFIPAIIPHISSAAAIADKNVSYGTLLSAITLPTSVSVTLSNSTTVTADIASWDIASYKADVPGTYTFIGTIAAAAGFTNESGVTASLKVKVAELNTDTLKALIKTAKDKKDAATYGTGNGSYAPAQKTALESAIAAAQSIVDRSGVTIAELTSGMTALQIAIDNFNATLVVVNYTALNDLITQCETLHAGAEEGTDTGKYAQGSKAVFKTAIDAAKSVAGNTAATQTAVDAAKTALQSALDLFKSKQNTEEGSTVNFDVLNALITTARSKAGDSVYGDKNGDYPASAKTVLESAITAASAVADNASVTQAIVDAAEAVLKTALEAFNSTKIIVNYQPLKDLIGTAEALKSLSKEGSTTGSYPASAMAALKAAIDAAAAFADDTHVSQQMVDAAVTALAKAVSLFGESKITSDITDDDPDGIDNSDGTGDTNTQDSPSNSNGSNSSNDSPKTGDHASATLSMLMILGLASIVLISRKRKA